MGQYWLVCNLSKNEFIDPHRLGCGLKLCEQVGSFPGTASGLLILCAAQREVRGGGDLDTEDNWHGPERESVGPGPMPKEYPTIARRTIGRWAGDRIALVGDYAENSDLPPRFKASTIYKACRDGEWLDISEDVAKVICHENGGRFVDMGGYWDYAET